MGRSSRVPSRKEEPVELAARQPPRAEINGEPAAENRAIPAFEELWRRVGPSLERKCLNWMSGHADSAEEAYSRAALLAFQKYSRHLNQLNNPAAWLMRLTYNVCMDLHRELRRKGSYGFSDEALVDDVQETGLFGSASDPERDFLSSEGRAVLELSVHKLPPKLKEVMVPVFIEGKSFKQVAEQLVISPAALRKRVQEARIQIRRRFALYQAGKLQL